VELVLAGVIAALLVERWASARTSREEQAAWRLERASLLQRIQAPERAVVAHEVPAEAVNPPAVNGFDDQDYWDEQQRMLTEIQRMERGPWAS
jgi:hypothetical protein